MGIHMEGPSPKASPLEGVLKDIISGIKKKGLLTEEELAGVWKKAAGRKASPHTRPVSLKTSGLVVNVDGSSWLYELTLKRKEILEKLKKALGERNAPKDIRFRIGSVK